MCRLYFASFGRTYQKLQQEVCSMNEKRIGRRTIALTHPPSVLTFSNIGGKFEKLGPLSNYFD